MLVQKCPYCSAPAHNRHFGCGSLRCREDVQRSATCRLRQIVAYAQRHASAANEPGTHRAMREVLRMAGELD